MTGVRRTYGAISSCVARIVCGEIIGVAPGRACVDMKLVDWQTDYMIDVSAVQAIGNPRRLQVLEWLKDPRAHFPPQVDGDLVRDGVCAARLAEKLGISQPTLSEHMRVLCHAGLVEATRIRQWTFYRRNEPRIRALKRAIAAGL
jgi:ArsR family transcriptional regulator